MTGLVEKLPDLPVQHNKPAAAGGSGVAGAKAYLRTHQKPLALGAAAAVAALAYVQSRKAGAGADDGSTDSGNGADLPGSGTGTLDTTQSDTYNEIAPELQNIGSRLDDLDNAIGNGFAKKPPARKPAPKKKGHKKHHPARRGRHPHHRPRAGVHHAPAPKKRKPLRRRGK